MLAGWLSAVDERNVNAAFSFPGLFKQVPQMFSSRRFSSKAPGIGESCSGVATIVANWMQRSAPIHLYPGANKIASRSRCCTSRLPSDRTTSAGASASPGRSVAHCRVARVPQSGYVVSRDSSSVFHRPGANLIGVERQSTKRSSGATSNVARDVAFIPRSRSRVCDVYLGHRRGWHVCRRCAEDCSAGSRSHKTIRSHARMAAIVGSETPRVPLRIGVRLRSHRGARSQVFQSLGVIERTSSESRGRQGS